MKAPSKSWIKFTDRLTSNFPTDKPVKIVFVPSLDALGYTHDKGSHYLVELRLEKRLWIMKETLTHEYAHILAGWTDGRSAHTNKWGIWFARIWRVMVDKESR